MCGKRKNCLPAKESNLDHEVNVWTGIVGLKQITTFIFTVKRDCWEYEGGREVKEGKTRTYEETEH